MSNLEPIRADLENVRLANVRLANVRLANVRLANVRLANVRLAIIRLAIIRRRHPGWQIASQSGFYTALSRPAKNSEHFVVRPTLTELDSRLNELDGR